MTFEEIIKTILPDITWEFDDIYLNLDKLAMEKSGVNFERKVKKGTEFKVTFDKEKNGFGINREEDKTKKFHTGVDLSYGKDCAFNFIHPRIYSPVYGEIVMLEDSDTEKLIGIESFGYLHIFEHFHSIDNYKFGDFVGIGSLLGQIGGTGETGLYHYEQHLHYEIRCSFKDYDGIVKFDKEKLNLELLKKEYIALNPLEFWNNGREFGQYFSLNENSFIESEENFSDENTVSFQMNFSEMITDVNGKNYSVGEFIFKDKKWVLLTKEILDSNKTFESLCEEKTKASGTIYDKTHFDKNRSEFKGIKDSKIELMNYAIIDGDLNLTLRENYIETSSDKNTYSRLMPANSSKDFTLYSDIFICTELDIKKNKNDEIEEILLKESNKAFKELFDMLKEESYGSEKN